MLRADSGFTIFPNALREVPWRNKPKTVAVYFWLRMHANHFRVGWDNVELAPGELVMGRASLAVQTGLTQNEVRTALDHLKSTGYITIKSTNKFSIISFTDKENWRTEHISSTSEFTSNTASRAPAEHQQTTTERNLETKKRGDCAPANPSFSEAEAFFLQRGATAEQAENFFDYYEGVGWMSGKTPIRSWEALARKWIRGDLSTPDNGTGIGGGRVAIDNPF